MRAYLVLTICSVAASLGRASPLSIPLRALPVQSPNSRGTEIKIGKQTTGDAPALDLNQFCELLESEEQRTQCLDYVSRHVQQRHTWPEGPAKEKEGEGQGLLSTNKFRTGPERVPLDLQVFIPSEDSWYLQDSHNHKFLGKPLADSDRKPSSSGGTSYLTAPVGGKGETVIRI